MNNYRRIFIFLIGALLIGCTHTKTEKTTVMEPSELVPFVADSIHVEGDLGTFKIALEPKILPDGRELVTIKLTSDKAAEPPKFKLKWKFPSVEIYKFWNPKTSVDRVNYYYNSISSSSTSLAPVVSFMDSNDSNRFAFALADGLNKLNLSTELIEEDACFHCEVEFFSEKSPAITSYETELLIDRRNRPYTEILSEITTWWASHENYTPAVAPKETLRPMYSTWYSYHQNLDVDKIVEECRQGKEIGLDAVIVDDGWQTMDSKRGYAYTGDWMPDRIPDMKGFVDRIHQLDMKFLLWYSVPFVGKNAKNFDRFKGKYLYNWDSQGASVLDPRYPEVREFIITTYEKAITDWGLDGFKFDFMGFFKAGKGTPLTKVDGRDFASINQAVDKLMTDIMLRLKSMNSQIMIEFRQPYIGPLMRKYGNMLRAADCPNMAVVNKVRVTDIRLLAGTSAVHSDMLMWHDQEPVESAALQLLNVIFSVPQISVRLNEIPKEHKKMVAFWIEYWNRNQETLIGKGFFPKYPDALYPIIQAGDSTRMVTAVYGHVNIENHFTKFPKSFHIINARNNNQVVMVNDSDYGKFNFRIYNCVGEQVSQGTMMLKKGAMLLNVPPSGLIEFEAGK